MIFPNGVFAATAEREELRGGRGAIPTRQRSSAASQVFSGDFLGSLMQSAGLVSNERAFRESSILRPLIHASAATLAARPFRMFQDGADGSKDQLKQNWLIDLMARPNVYAPLDEYSLKYQTFSLYFVDGEVLWHKGRSTEGKPKKSGKRPPVDFITIFNRASAKPSIERSSNEFRGWELSIDGIPYFADRTDVIHFPQYDPTRHAINFNPFTMTVRTPGRGSSMIDTKRRAISADIAMAQFNLDYFSRGVASDYAFIGRGIAASDKQKNEFREKLIARFAGKNGEPFILATDSTDPNTGWDVKYLGGAHQRDAEYTKGRQGAKEEQMVGIAPPIIAMESDATYANATVQNLTWCETILIPAAMYYCAVMDVSLLADQPGVWCDLSFDDVEALQYQKRERMKSIVDLGRTRVPLSIAARMNSVEMEDFPGSEVPFGSYTDIPVEDILAGKDKAEIAVVPTGPAPPAVPDTPVVPENPDVTKGFIRVVMADDDSDTPQVTVVGEEEVQPVADQSSEVARALTDIISADDKALQAIARKFHVLAASVGSEQIRRDLSADKSASEDGLRELLDSRASMVTQVNRTTEQQVTEAMGSGGDQAASIRSVFNARKKDSDFIAVSESVATLNGGRFLQLSELGVGAGWLASRSDRQCPIHPIGSAIDGEVTTDGRTFTSGCRYPQDSAGPIDASLMVSATERRSCDCLVVPANGHDLFTSEPQRAAYWKSNVALALRNVEKQFSSQLGRYFNDQRGRVLAELAKRAAAKESSPQVAVNDLSDRAVKGASGSFKSLAKQVREIVARAETIEEVPDLLSAAFKELDATELETIIRRAMFSARLYGRTTVKK